MVVVVESEQNDMDEAARLRRYDRDVMRAMERWHSRSKVTARGD